MQSPVAKYYYVALIGFEFENILLSPECWDYRHCAYLNGNFGGNRGPEIKASQSPCMHSDFHLYLQP